MAGSQAKYLSQAIRDVVEEVAREEGVEIRSIILFGSRARDDYKWDSDWDLLIIVSGSPDRRTLRRLQYKVYNRLARNKLYSDIIVVSEDYYAKYKNVVGTIAYYAHLEGKPIE